MSKSEDAAIAKARERYGDLIEVESRSQKYRAFEIPGKVDRKVFIGTHGAIRVGKTVSNSISLTDTLPAGKPDLTKPKFVSAEGIAMDAEGRYPGAKCQDCGTLLGVHPAENYAGTYNGLCNPCTNKHGFVVETFDDGAKKCSYPPDCPSHSRQRSVFIGYDDCPDCKGSGYINEQGTYGNFKSACMTCLQKFTQNQG